ncbi:MAG TPA: hypothetical protein VFW44_10535 [Bryobacteraceae bacterium]|nr:hypothetical protein [Bryobacteraceae bacterium]
MAVLWLVAALTAIAFTLASTVRGETERSSTDADALKAYYLAEGAIERALVYIESPPTAFSGPDRKPMFQQDQTRLMLLDYPTGVARVEYIPENSKLDVNKASPMELNDVLLALGVDPERAQQIVAGIVDWRGGTPGGSFSQFDQYYLSLTPSFRARHASLQEIEELLLVRGITPDLFYGHYTRDAEGHLAPHDGLRDCLSVYGSTGVLDVNGVAPEVMMAVGVPPASAAAIVALRKIAPIRQMNQLAALNIGGRGRGRLGQNGGPMVTLRATATIRLPNGQFSEVRRTVSAMIKQKVGGSANPQFQIMRWYDNAPILQ